MKKTIVVFSLFFICVKGVSQNKSTFYATVKDSLQFLKDVHILNLNTNQGTITNRNGEFKIKASIGDTIQLSSIQHKIKKIQVSKVSFSIQKQEIYLQPKVYALDEIIIKKHNLTGSLTTDIKNVPKISYKDSIFKINTNFSKINFNTPLPQDDIDKFVKPPVVTTVANSFGGAGTSIGVPFGDSEKLWAFRKELKQKKEFPQKLLQELGEGFFFKKLKIPVEKYYHFLEYCNPLGIETLYKKDKILKLIKIFREESIEYLKIIKKH